MFVAGIEANVLAERLNALVRAERGPGARVHGLRVMEDGHAGLTFGFEVQAGSGASESYILKLAPVGVPRRGSTDVFRQAVLLRALHAAGLPAPALVWAAEDEAVLGTPFIVMERLPGRVFLSWNSDGALAGDDEAVRELWLQAVRALAGFHRLDWTRALADWEAPHTLDSELKRWHSLLSHAPEPHWLEAGQRVHRTLLATLPPEGPIGLIHGDYQPGNVLYEQGRLTGVIDWDLAGIGPQGTDIGWLLMMIDPAAWVDDWRPLAPLTRERLIQTYRDAGGTALENLAWFQAFAQFRLGAIAGLNVKLHRDGRRHDPIWERFALAVSSLFARAQELLEGVDAPVRSTPP